MEIGIDIQATNAFKDFRKNKRFYERIFTKNEIAYCIKKKDYKSCFCGKFCAKEAIIKIFDKEYNLENIEILNSKTGRPYAKIKLRKKENILISLSHTKDTCVAVVIKK